METNYKHYFGTPRRTSNMNIIPWSDNEGIYDGIDVWRDDDLVAHLCYQEGDRFRAWLESEYKSEESCA